MRPSPARARPHDPAAWLPVPDVDTLPDVSQLLAPAAAPPPLPAPPVPPAIAKPEPQQQRAPSRTRPRPGTGLKAVVAGVAALALVLAGMAYAVPRVFAGGGASGPEVELTIGDKVTTISTEAATVGAVLEAENVRLHAADEVTPPLDTPVTDGMSVVVDLAVPITINLDGALTDVRSAADSVDQMLASVPELQRTKFESDPAAPIDPGAPLMEGAVYTFRTPRTVGVITGNGAREEVRTTAISVGEFLSRRDTFPDLAGGDHVSPPLDTPIPIEGVLEITYLTALETRAFYDALTPDAPAGAPVIGAMTADGCIGPTIGGVCSAVPGPAGLPQTGTSQTGTATHYELRPGNCAHLTLPFGTVVTVRNTANGATATCTVGDRGPEEWTGHIIDLNPDVFAQLAALSQGVIHVEISW